MTKVAYAGPRHRIDPNITATFGIFKNFKEFLTDFIVFENCQIRSKWWSLFGVRLGRTYSLFFLSFALEYCNGL